MKKALFKELLESVKQAGEVARRKRKPSRTFEVSPKKIQRQRRRNAD